MMRQWLYDRTVLLFKCFVLFVCWDEKGIILVYRWTVLISLGSDTWIVPWTTPWLTIYLSGDLEKEILGRVVKGEAISF